MGTSPRVHGGKLVASALQRQGIDHIFTLCGGHIQAIYDGCLDHAIRVVDVRHEQTAGHAADAYARVTGRPGVCVVTAGPGVTDTVTALANAQRAGVPLVCLGGAGPLPLRDRGSLQDMDSVTLLRPITKWAAQVSETRRIHEYIDAAFRVAQANTPGPVYLELPLDVLLGLGDEPPRASPPLVPARAVAAPSEIERAATLLREAQRPTVLLGSQLRWSPHPEAAVAAADAWQAPFFTNGMARAALPCDHPGRFAHVRRRALREADLVLVFGTPFDFRLDYGRAGTWNPTARVVHVDLDGAELGKNRPVDVALQGDSGLVLRALLERVPEKRTHGWLEPLRLAEQERLAAIDAEIAAAEDPVLPPNPLRVCQALGRRLGPADIVIGDGGDFVATAANVLQLQAPQLWMDPGPFGTLGIGPGYAMAAALTRPHARTVLVFGDGAFGLHALEFEAMVRQRLPVVALIGNDAAWTQIRRGQVQMYGAERAVATRLAATRYDQVVEAVGGRGFWVERLEQLDAALDAAFACTVPACVNVQLGASEFRKGAISV